MAGKAFGGKQGANWKHSGMTQKRYDTLKKAHDAAAALRKGSGKTAVTKTSSVPKVRALPKRSELAKVKLTKYQKTIVTKIPGMKYLKDRRSLLQRQMGKELTKYIHG